jgi:hypothetical protein
MGIIAGKSKRAVDKGDWAKALRPLRPAPTVTEYLLSAFPGHSKIYEALDGIRRNAALGL